VVWSAYHQTLGRHVAVKLLPPGFAADDEVRQQFRSEAKLIASLNHPHIAQVHDFIETGDLYLLVMERLDGGTLWDRFSTSGLSPAGACAAVLAASVALHHAHGRGVLHRDVKPQNLMFDAKSTLKVTDFGMAKVLTGSHQVLGTPAYMPPEQVLGQEVTPGSDVYALGSVLYELLSGRLPYEAERSALAMLHAHAYEDPIPLRDLSPSVPESLAAVTMKAIARDRTRRYHSAEEFGAGLATAANQVWDTGWLGRTRLIVVPAGKVAQALSLPPKVRDPRADETDAHPVAVTDESVVIKIGTRSWHPGQASDPPDVQPLLKVIAEAVEVAGVGRPEPTSFIPGGGLDLTYVGKNAEAILTALKPVIDAPSPTPDAVIIAATANPGTPRERTVSPPASARRRRARWRRRR